MSDQRTCPSAEQLQLLMLGKLPESSAVDLEQHLLECGQCTQRTAMLQSADTLVEALQRVRSLQPAEHEPRVNGLIDALRGLRTQQSDATVCADTDEAPSPDKPAAAHADVTFELSAAWGPPETPDELGRLGHYRILRLLGVGGMGAVYLAEDLQLRRHVALKLMRPRISADPAAAGRFLREARSAAALRHDNILTIYQVGEDRGVPFLAAEYLEGESLDSRLARKPILDPNETLRIAHQMAEGLAVAHAKGLIHRDIKPANVWLEAGTDRVKLLDFGLARSAESDVQLTASGAILGTPAYMAPEQASGDPLDARADLFSLGVVLYRMTTGVLPFPGRNTMEILSALATRVPPAPNTLNPLVDGELSDLIVKLLSKSPAERPGSARTVVEELRRIEQRLAQAPATAAAETPEHGSNRRMSLWLMGAVGAALLAMIVIVLRRPDGSKTTITAPDDTIIEVQRSEAVPRPAGAPSLPVDYKTERSTAEFILSNKGRVAVGPIASPPRELQPGEGLPEERMLNSVEQLPREDFVVHTVEWRTDDEHVEHLMRLSRLRDLSLWSASITDASLKRLAKHPHLEVLFLSKCDKLTDQGVASLADLKTLKLLDLGLLGISDRVLPDIGRMQGLTVLSLWGTPVSDAGVVHLAKLKNLKLLRLQGTTVSPDAARRLRSALPNCNVEHHSTEAQAGAAVSIGSPDLPKVHSLEHLKYEDIPQSERIDRQPGELVAVIGEHRGRTWDSNFTNLLIDPLGRFLVSDGENWNSFAAWSVEDMRSLPTGDRPTGIFRGKNFSSDGSLFLVGDELFAIEGDRKQIRWKRIASGDFRCSVCVFSPDKRWILVLRDDRDSSIDVLEIVEERPIRRQTIGITDEAGKPVTIVDLQAVPSGGAWKLFGQPPMNRTDAPTLVWSLEWLDEGPKLTQLTSYDGLWTQFSADGNTALQFLKGAWHLWDCSGESPQRLDAPAGEGWRYLAPTGNLFVDLRANEGWLYRRQGNAWELSPHRLRHDDSSRAAFSADGKLLATTGGDGCIRLWDLSGDVPRKRYEPPRFTRNTRVEFSPDGRYLGIDGYDGAALIDLTGRAPRRVPETEIERGHAWSLAWSFSGNMAFNSAYQSGVAFDLAADPPQRLTADLASKRLWLLPSGNRLLEWDKNLSVYSWEVTRSGDFRLGSREQTIVLDGFSIPPHTYSVFNPCVPRLIVWGENPSRVGVWDLGSNSLLHSGEMSHRLGRFSLDGTKVALWDGTLRVWDLDSNPVDERLSRLGYVHAAEFSARGSRLVLARGTDILLHDWMSDKMLLTIPMPGTVRDVRIHPDGRHIASVNYNGTVYILRLKEALQ